MKSNDKITKILGWVFVVAMAITAKPELISFLPDSIESYISGLSNLLAVVAGGGFASTVKNKNVTGGKIPANEEAKERVEKNDKLISLEK